MYEFLVMTAGVLFVGLMLACMSMFVGMVCCRWEAQRARVPENITYEVPYPYGHDDYVHSERRFVFGLLSHDEPWFYPQAPQMPTELPSTTAKKIVSLDDYRLPKKVAL